MRNAIVFINMCIVAAVTMVVMDFDTTSSLPRWASRAETRTSATGDSLAAAALKGTALATLKTISSSPSRRVISDTEQAFVKNFIDEMSRARIASLAQAKMASQRGTSRSLKDYGAWMVVHQERMIKDLKKLAKLHRMEFPEVKEAPPTEELSDLAELHGKKFDSRYIKLMTLEYKKDIKLLERAGYSTDPDVQVFAARYLSITQANYDKLRGLR